MNRKQFLGVAGLASLAMAMKPLSELEKLSNSLGATQKMPVLFLGHGDPMNAIRENEYVIGFKNIAKTLPKPKAIICISAHWLTKGTQITAMEHPKTIHDFGGFPQELYDVQYKAKGSPELAKQTQKIIGANTAILDHDWGLDHGAWTVIKHLYPDADIPVIQLSIDYYKDGQYHYELAKKLQSLREKGILIIGSGNIVHNLRRLDFKHKPEDNYGYDWAYEARNKINKLLLDGNHQAIIDYKKLGREVQLAVPTPDHYFPLLYTLGLKEKNEKIKLFNDKLIEGSISMTSIKIG